MWLFFVQRADYITATCASFYNSLFSSLLHTNGAVSYTHLDVYKRQPLLYCVNRQPWFRTFRLEYFVNWRTNFCRKITFLKSNIFLIFTYFIAICFSMIYGASPLEAPVSKFFGNLRFFFLSLGSLLLGVSLSCSIVSFLAISTVCIAIIGAPSFPLYCPFGLPIFCLPLYSKV